MSVLGACRHVVTKIDNLRGGAMFYRMWLAVVTATLCVALGSSVARAQAVDKTTRDRARQECIRNGGWYHQELNFCEYESKAKAALIENDQQECEQNGGWFHRDLGTCEVESKAKK